MRLTDRLVVLPAVGDEPVGGPYPCHMGHKGGAMVGDTDYQAIYYQERAAAIVKLPDDLARLILGNPTGYRVRHRNNIYRVTSSQARYRTHGRLHHVTLDLERPGA